MCVVQTVVYLNHSLRMRAMTCVHPQFAYGLRTSSTGGVRCAGASGAQASHVTLEEQTIVQGQVVEAAKP